MRHGRCHCFVATVPLPLCRCHCAVAIVSWPGLARLPTTGGAGEGKVVGGGAKPGHDTVGYGGIGPDETLRSRPLQPAQESAQKNLLNPSYGFEVRLTSCRL